MALPASVNNTDLLTLQNVTKAYGVGPKKNIAICEVNLNIRPGEFVGLLGPPGAASRPCCGSLPD
ncbi:MAG: hypothetical protein MPW14_00635 [Candidatus Manganitrophus sp.]|nr:MAG: hypothetical protein MPW14_00635 [Candidatus Manganitrophus sp.]